MRQWTVWAMVLLFCGSARIAAADTDWCYQYLQTGENDKAIDACTRDLLSGEYDGEPRIQASRLYYRGKAYFNKLGKRNYDKAFSDISKAIRLLPDNVSTIPARSFYDTRGRVCISAGRYDQAIADYTKLLTYGEYSDWEQSRGTAYWLKGEYEKAVADLSAGITVATRQGGSGNLLNDSNVLAPLYQERGDIYYSLGEYENAVADLTKALKLLAADQDGIRLQIWLALSRLSPQRAESYREELQKVVRDRWPGTIAKYFLGTEGVTEKDVLDEVRQGQDVVIRGNLFSEAYYYLGEARLMRGDGKGAEAFFKKSAGIDTRYWSYQRCIARVLLQRMKKGKLATAAPAGKEQSGREQTTNHEFRRGFTKCGTFNGNFGSF